MHYYDEAVDDFGGVLKLEPDNRVAKRQLSIAVKHQAEGAAQERSIFAGMFKKFAEQDLSVCLNLALFILIFSVSVCYRY